MEYVHILTSKGKRTEESMHVNGNEAILLLIWNSYNLELSYEDTNCDKLDNGFGMNMIDCWNYKCSNPL